MATFTSLADIITAFGGPGSFSEETGINYSTVNTMKGRNSIPPAVWKKIEAAARRKAIEGLDRYNLADIVLSQFPDEDDPKAKKPRPADRVSA